MPSLSPIVIFAYKRAGNLKRTMDALAACELAPQSEVIIFSDCYKDNTDRDEVMEVRDYLDSITGFRNIRVYKSEKNMGLANSIIQGVTMVLKENGKIIVLEDDLLVSKNFLVYMNSALEYYKETGKVFSIAGYSIPVIVPENYPSDVYFTPRSSSWGWATWNDRWDEIDWQMSDYLSFRKNRKDISQFNRGGSDLSGMLERQMKGDINSWAIRWCYHQFRTGSLAVYPVVSKVQNIGFSDQATHSNVYNRYKTHLDKGADTKFKFTDNVELNSYFLKQFQNFYSVKTRVLNKLKTLLYKAGIISNKNG